MYHFAITISLINKKVNTCFFISTINSSLYTPSFKEI